MTQDSNKACEASQPQERQSQQPQYAVHPRHHHSRLGYSDRGNHLKLRNTLNIAFMIFAIVGVVVWTQIETEETGHTMAAIFLLVGVVLKIAEVCIRLFNK